MSESLSVPCAPCVMKRKVAEVILNERPSKVTRMTSESPIMQPTPSDTVAPQNVNNYGTPLYDYMMLAYCRESWLGEKSLQNVIVFGGSYSLYEASEVHSENDELEDSLSDYQSTWVAHLSRELHSITQTRSFAVNGATTAEDLSSQLARFFMEFPSKVSSGTTLQTLAADSTTYFFFLGSNDCGQTDTETDDLDTVVETLLDGAHNLYVKAGARNFVFLDVAPMDRTPVAIATGSEERMIERTAAWNESLQRRAQEFANETPRASIFLFSANAVLSAVLDEPEEYDFTPDDVEMEGGPIWEDELHPATEVHAILADKLLRALRKQASTKQDQE